MDRYAEDYDAVLKDYIEQGLVKRIVSRCGRVSYTVTRKGAEHFSSSR